MGKSESKTIDARTLAQAGAIAGATVAAAAATAADLVGASPATQPAADLHPDDVADADPALCPARGGSYVVENGVRRLVERTEVVHQAQPSQG